MSKIKWYWWVLGALFFAAAGGGVLYGVRTHKEAGLLKVCWQPEGAVYNQEICPDDVKWEKTKLPLTYYIDFGPSHKAYIDSVVKGAQMWNQEIGVELLKRTEDKNKALVTIKWGTVESTAAGYVQHQGNPTRGATSALLTLTEPSDIHSVFRFAAHEFGHVLGLAHDDHAIMKAELKKAELGEIKFTVPSDYDKKLLQELYK